jgi:predicted unusual protein kinase regulating ubiquinone biosynthesis (AarF/ABC1/UbiB family)
VVAKVQYPGVEDNMEGDLKNLKSLLSMGSIVGYRKRDLDETFAEIRDRLEEELNYEQELENLLEFRERFRDDPRIVIPRVFPPYCSRRVLTLEYLPGDPLEALLSPPYTQDDRNHFGRLLFDLYLHQVLRLGLLHADPHPGNFAFRRDGRMILYDFGCLKRIPPHIREAGRDILAAAIRSDYREIDVALLRLGSRDPRKEAPPPDFYRQYVEVFRDIVDPETPYDFRTSSIHERLFELAPLGFTKMLHFKPSRDLVFIVRVIGGHYGNLRHMRASARWWEIVAPYLDP